MPPKKDNKPRKSNCKKSDEEINPATGRCRKKCKPDQIRNPETGRCVKRDGAIGRRIRGVQPPKRQRKAPKQKYTKQEHKDLKKCIKSRTRVIRGRNVVEQPCVN